MATMEQQLQQIAAWLHAGPAFAAVDARTLVSFSFVGFNAFRIFLHIPQVLTCLRDAHGCSAINLWTWASLVAASVSTALYMWLCLGDTLGVVLNLANAAMCATTVCITLFKRRRARTATLYFMSPTLARRHCAREALPSRLLPG
jgi:hypothetical protein